MKKIIYQLRVIIKKSGILSIIVILSSIVLFGQPEANILLPRVDKRVELLSIACRLANIQGFNDNQNPVYTVKIDKYFSNYKNHLFIQHLRELKSTLDEAYWDVPAVAAHLSQPPELSPLMSFEDTSNVDDWESRTLFNARFVNLLQQFYRDSKAENFFNTQKSYYQLVNKQYEKQGVKLNKPWFQNFFGIKTSEDYYPIVALLMRKGAYMRINFPKNFRHTVTIFETTEFDNQGVPTTFVNPVFPRLMMHEYIHAFTNQLIDKNRAELQKHSENILKDPKVFKLVEKTFYGNWQFLLYESMVRACSIKYLKENNEIGTDIEKEITNQEKAGFLWMRGLVEELDKYEANRSKYKNLDEFMPEINKFFKQVAES